MRMNKSNLQVENQLNFRSVEIERAGERIKIGILLIDDTEGVTVQQAADLFGVSYQNIYKHMAKYAICSQPLVESITNELKSLGVIPLRTNRNVRFLSKSALKDLMWVIGTDSAKAAYYQLWNDSEQLQKIIPELRAEKLKSEKLLELAESVQRQNEALVKEMADLTAKLQAATHHISLGGNKRARRFAVPIYRREPNDIFDSPVYAVEVVKKSLADMSKAEHGKFQLYHSSKTMVGLSNRLVKQLSESLATNIEITQRAEQLCAMAKSLNNDITPRSLLN